MFITKLVVGSDHAGYELKTKLIQFIKDELPHIYVEDYGCYSTSPVDYPDIAYEVSRRVQIDSSTIVRGLLICGTGIGMSMVANRFPGIRAVVTHNPEIVMMSRKHNDANVLCLGARFITDEQAMKCLMLFHDVPFSDEERHIQRLLKFGFLSEYNYRPNSRTIME